jgi:hypothetical protein
LAPGTYTIREVLKPGWAQTTPPGAYTVTVTRGDAASVSFAAMAAQAMQAQVSPAWTPAAVDAAIVRLYR